MKMMKEIILSKLFLLSFFMIGVVFLIGVFLSITLSAQNQADADKERMKQLEKSVKEQEEMFWKVSPAAIPADEGNKIVAVRRVNLIYDDVDAKGNTFKNRKLMYEVELFSKVIIPVTNSTQYLIIGDIALPEPFITGDRHTIFAHLQQKEFEQLKDGAIISLLISPVQINSETLKQIYKDGEPKEITGAKFGRMDKSAAERFPVIEEDSKTQLSRLSGTKKD
jgi:hypothetical protein